ncbi:MAG: glycosyltransferase family 1 protein [Piscinibacter sp.]|nr:glycosyltransferase family 1 protein [Piscinibacter sp.]
MSLATDALLRHVQEFGYRSRPFVTDLAQAPQRADRFGDQLYFGVLGYEREVWSDARTMLTLAAGHDEPAGDAALFYLGLVQARLGEPALAFDTLLRAFGRGMRLAPALLEAACLAQRLGDEGTAVALYRQFIGIAGDREGYRRLLSLDELHAYNRALAALSPRVATLLAPCALLGRAAPALTGVQQRTIGALLDATADAQAAGQLAPTELAGRWTAAPAPARPRRVLLLFARHINCSERYVESDVLYHLEQSARARGHEVRVFDADRLLYGTDAVPAERVIDGAPYRPTPEATARELQRLQQAVEDFAPDLLLFEANFVPTATTLGPDFLATLPGRPHMNVVAVVPDLYDSAPDFAGAWSGAADRVLCFNEHGQHAQRQRDAGRLVYFPHLPFAPNPHAQDGPREWDFVFAGGLQRGRDAVLAPLVRHVPRHRIVAGDRRATSALPDVDQFYRFLASGHVTFNSGFLPPPQPPIQTGRTVEAMLARTALLEESPAALARGWVPWLHFVPVAHAAQAVACTQFLAAHADHRTRLVDAALAQLEAHFSPRHFWTQLESLA